MTGTRTANIEEVISTAELRDYARGREDFRKHRPEPPESEEWRWLGFVDERERVSLFERYVATKNGMHF